MKQQLIATEVYDGQSTKVRITDKFYKNGYGDYFFVDNNDAFKGPFASMDQVRQKFNDQ